jgi:LuxR family maltose regulon positive regulatory protein
VLLRSWIAESGLDGQVARVTVPAGCDAPRFWISVAGALRDTAAGPALVRPLTAAPDLDGWTVVERLLEDLATLTVRIWLVIDDLHELSTPEALRQLELLIMRAPPDLRFVLVTRHELRLGLHRLRLSGELTEIRAADLRFSEAEGRALLDTAGVPLSGSAAACASQRCRSPVIPILSVSRPNSAAASAPSPSTCSPRSSSGSRQRCGGYCCEPRFSTGSTASSPTC